jgi:hypothetical protein
MSASGQQHVYDYFIDEHGHWVCEGNPVVDRRLFQLLSRTLFQKDGDFFIRCEGEVHPVRVGDAPLWIRYVHVRTDSKGDLIEVKIELEDGRIETLAAETLTVAGDQALYCLATSRRMKARFGKSAYYELTRYLQMDDDNTRFCFIINGKRYSIRPEPDRVRISPTA